MTDRDPEFEAWVEEARNGSFDTAMALCGFQPQKGHQNAIDRAGPCPACGGNDRFAVHMRKRQFNCRGCDAKGGDALSLALVGGHVDFIGACEELTGRPRPKTDRKAEARPVDHERDQMRREVQKDREVVAGQQDKAERAKKANRAQEIFDSAVAIKGTHGEAYYKARGIRLAREQQAFLRFVPDHKFFHGVDQDGRPVCIGTWPAIIARMFDAAGAVVGVHCTYLDRERPVKAYIVPDGEDGPVNPRKMYGSAGLIWLSEILPVVAIGEGIETTLSWYQLGVGPDECGIAAAGSLGNLSGRSRDRVPHPTQAKRSIPNGIPDPESPGMPVPDPVREIILLGDADGGASINVRAHLLTAGRRHSAAGRTVSIHMSPLPAGEDKFDWNDVLMRGAA